MDMDGYAEALAVKGPPPVGSGAGPVTREYRHARVEGCRRNLLSVSLYGKL